MDPSFELEIPFEDIDAFLNEISTQISDGAPSKDFVELQVYHPVSLFQGVNKAENNGQQPINSIYNAVDTNEENLAFASLTGSLPQSALFQNFPESVNSQMLSSLTSSVDDKKYPTVNQNEPVNTSDSELTLSQPFMSQITSSSPMNIPQAIQDSGSAKQENLKQKQKKKKCQINKEDTKKKKSKIDKDTNRLIQNRMAAKKLRDKKKSEKLILEKQVLDLLRENQQMEETIKTQSLQIQRLKNEVSILKGTR